ncbi:MAG: hypothetical protein PHY54_13655 [Methylococcales bacterium]|nr:hypothetical protein [Methylococcales bacterium]
MLKFTANRMVIVMVKKTTLRAGDTITLSQLNQIAINIADIL